VDLFKTKFIISVIVLWNMFLFLLICSFSYVQLSVTVLTYVVRIVRKHLKQNTSGFCYPSCLQNSNRKTSEVFKCCN